MNLINQTELFFIAHKQVRPVWVKRPTIKCHRFCNISAQVGFDLRNVTSEMLRIHTAIFHTITEQAPIPFLPMVRTLLGSACAHCVQ